MIVRFYFFYVFLLFQWKIKQIHSEKVYGCTINNNNNSQSISSDKKYITLSCTNNRYILVQNLIFGAHKTPNSSCSYQPGDCTTSTKNIGLGCNGLTNCNIDLNSQFLHSCSQYSDYMVLDYLCLQGESLSICDNRSILISEINLKHRLLIRSPNYPNEYENSLNCSCEIDTKEPDIEFLDFYLEKGDEMNSCTQDYLQIGNQSYCGSTTDRIINLNSSIHLTFKTNDVIARRGFWLMINTYQSLHVSCKNSFESSFPTASPTTIKNSSHFHSTRRYTLSFILILTILTIIFLGFLLLNFFLIIHYRRQRRSKESINSKTSRTRSFLFSNRLSKYPSSPMTYGETSVLTSLDTQKRLITSPTVTATHTYEDPNELLTSQSQEKFDHNHSFYLQPRHEPKSPCSIDSLSCSTKTGYNQMLHYAVAPIPYHFSRSTQTFYPPYPNHPLNSQRC